jgi:tetratricopeptide (TPR) repeat protein
VASAVPPHQGDAEPESAAGWLAAVTDEERRGELLSAFDLAERGLARHPDDVSLKHRAVLALARAGATDEARRRFDEYGLAAIEAEDVAALRARIAKDVALAAVGDDRRRHALEAAALYGAVYARTGGYYPAINAATLSMIAGESERARELARQVLRLVGEPAEDYYAAATEAEAQLLLGRADDAHAALVRAAGLHGGDDGAVATTRRQLRLVCEATGVDVGVLAELPAPAVAHYCGHVISPHRGRFPATAADNVAQAIAAEVLRHPSGYAYGSLASGSDILWAEALLAQGADLHVVLPFDREEFIEVSVSPGGPGWIERFERCLARATSVSYATEDAYLGDDVLFQYASELAMGLALLRARYLDGDARQFAVWDGEPAAGVAGTAIDVAAWGGHGLPVSVVSPGEAASSHVERETPRNRAPAAGRVVRAMLFGDVKGFSKISDEHLPRFGLHVLGAFASVLEHHGADVCYRNTWGDALYVVLSDAAAAAACALELQSAIAAIDLEAVGLPAHLALRLAVHVGPVFHAHDPVVRAQSFMGSHVSRTARIEPVTPPGSVYVTEPFAAAIALAGRDEFVCDYVGHMPAAKDFGRLRMYRLRPRTTSPTASSAFSIAAPAKP